MRKTGDRKDLVLVWEGWVQRQLDVSLNEKCSRKSEKLFSREGSVTLSFPFGSSGKYDTNGKSYIMFMNKISMSQTCLSSISYIISLKNQSVSLRLNYHHPPQRTNLHNKLLAS